MKKPNSRQLQLCTLSLGCFLAVWPNLPSGLVQAAGPGGDFLIESPQDEKAAEDKDGSEEESATFSYALFLKKPRKLTKEAIQGAMQVGWGLEKSAVEKIRITGEKKEFTVRFQGVSYLVESANQPWLEDQEQIIEESGDRRMREMLRSVKANVSVTVDNKFKNEEDRDVALENAVHLLTGLIDLEDTLAVYDDDSGDFNYVDKEVMEALAGDDPLSAFEIEVMPPAVALDPKNPAIQTAVAEAHRRWPEFSKQFRDHGTSRGPFIVKTELGQEGHREALWCEVMTIMPGKIRAILKSEPTVAVNLAKGDQVTIPLDEITDWVYPDEEGEKVGAFTLDAVDQPKKKQ
jgi:uncharacterized protein YegJ (DUF2314 family)